MLSPGAISISIMVGLQSSQTGVDIPKPGNLALWEDDINAVFADDANAIHEDQ